MHDVAQIDRQRCVEPAVEFLWRSWRGRGRRHLSIVDPLLRGDMGLRLGLQVPLVGVCAVVTLSARSVAIGRVSHPSIRLL